MDVEASVEYLDSEVKQLKQQVSHIDSTVTTLAHDQKRSEDRREEDRAHLIKIENLLVDIQKQNKDGLHKAHERIDKMQEEAAVNRGIEQGRKDTRNSLFKWIGAIVGILAILGYIGSQQAQAQKLTREVGAKAEIKIKKRSE